jgi:DNA mismatch endonuclease (patch repair protein)
MVDVHSKETRSFNMSRIKGKNTKPEILVRKFLFANGFRYRIHDKTLPGKPDIVLKKYNTIIFIHGCFWHGHEGCKYFIIPKTRTEWWTEKIFKTVGKDTKNIEKLISLGWNVITLWECELRNNFRENTLKNLLFEIKKSNK